MSGEKIQKCPQCDIEFQESFNFCPNCGNLKSDNLLDARLRQIMNYQQQGNTWKAMEELKELAQLHPENAYVHKLLGHIYFRTGMIDWAIDSYKLAIKNDANYIDAHYDLGIALYHRARVNEAVAEYQTVLKLDPEYHAAHYRIGLGYHHAGQLNAAIHHLLESTRVTPDFVMAHYHLGVLYYKQSNFEKAAIAFKKVLEEDPEDMACSRYLDLISKNLAKQSND